MPSNNDKPIIIRDRRRRGFFIVFNELYDEFGATLGPYGLSVYMALCRYANQEAECWPSYGTIARGTNMSRRQVMREVAKLESLALIEVERNHHTSNVFILLDRGDTQSPPPPVTTSHSPVTDSHLNNP